MPDAPTDVPAELVHLDVVDGLATITLDSPHNRNALSRRLVAELAAHLDTVAGDPAVLVVRIRSSGRVFCSGADLSEATADGMQEGARAIVSLQRQIAALGQPVVLELLGAVRAGGIGIVAAADIVVAADDASFALTEVKLALAPAIISLTVLPRLTSRAAAYTCLTGEVFTGAEAVGLGLVTRSVPAEGLTAEVERVCASLATGAAQGLRETKALLNRRLLAGIDADGEALAALSARLFASEEATAAMTAFLARGR
ncbi:MAG: enoyl-CoA hydratase/isomerase family protein [Nocardioides sp.]|nr:enoyl-CoA hydratase/isomerase family protein [Nocardioides sp.]